VRFHCCLFGQFPLAAILGFAADYETKNRAGSWASLARELFKDVNRYGINDERDRERLRKNLEYWRTTKENLDSPDWTEFEN